MINMIYLYQAKGGVTEKEVTLNAVSTAFSHGKRVPLRASPEVGENSKLRAGPVGILAEGEGVNVISKWQMLHRGQCIKQ